MNERILKLSKQAGLQPYYDAQEGQIEKFAELIVEECAKVAVDCDVIEYSDFRQGVAREIKRHFGVKE